jgi:PadR family transcriptional regulator PadR
MTPIHLSYAAAAILQALAQGYRYGFDVMDFVGLPSGTVYPALRRLEAAGFVKSQWEKPELSQREARPARKYYDLTRSGREALSAAAARYRLPAADPLPSSRPARARG